MRRNRKIHGLALLQTCTSSMGAGFRLTVYKDDSFHIEDGKEIKVCISQGNNGSIERTLYFQGERAQLEIEQLPFDWYTLSLVYADGHSIEEAQCSMRFMIDQESGEGNQLRFQLDENTPMKEIEMRMYGDVSELHIHVMQKGVQGQYLPKEDAVYQYELISANVHQWIELNSCNGYETVMFLPRGAYTIVAETNAQFYFDNEEIQDALTLQENVHTMTIIEANQEKASMCLQVFVMDEQCVLTTPKDCYFQVELCGNNYMQTINLNEMNDFSMTLYDLEEGIYQLKAHDASGYTVLYEIEGQTYSQGLVEVGTCCRHINILYQSDELFHRPSFRIRKMIKGEGGCLQMPKEEDCFIVAVHGCGMTHSFYLTKENHFCVELADLCPGIYHIEEIECQGYVSHIQYVNGEMILDGCVEIDSCEGVDILLVNELKNNGKLQICKYEEDAQGNLIKPQEGCFAIRMHSFAYQEILMLKEENDYCVFLQQLAKGCYDIREVGGEHVLYSVDQGDWTNTARVIIDDDRLHEIRILNLQEENCGSVRIEKWMENEHCMLMHPSCNDQFVICINGMGIHEQLTLHAQNQWCVYVDDLPYGEYVIEELYAGDERYVVNGRECAEAIVLVQKELQEVKIINPLPHATTLQVSLCMIDCDRQPVCPDPNLEVVALIEGEDFCKEVVLCEENRWQALITGIQGDNVRVIQKDTMGYHVLYQVDGQLEAGALIPIDGKRHEVVLMNQYRCRAGILSIEKKWADDRGCLHSPKIDEHFDMLLSGMGLEIPFTLHAHNGFNVCFDDLAKGTYELCELYGKPCCFRVNGEEQEDGHIKVDVCDQYVEVINAMPSSACVSIAYQEDCGDCDGKEIQFALVGGEVHSVYALQANGEHLVIDDLSPGNYEIIVEENERIQFEINGVRYERGKFTLQQADICIILIREPWENCLTIHRYQQNEQGAYELVEHGNSCLTVTTEQGIYEVFLEETNRYMYTLYDLPFGNVCIQDQKDPCVRVLINGVEANEGCFCMQRGCYDAQIISLKKARGSIWINGSCWKDHTHHECIDQQMRLLLLKETGEQMIELSAQNDWEVVIDSLPQGRYTLRSLDQTICFYVNEIQSYNTVSFYVGNSKIKVQAVLQETTVQPCVTFQVCMQDAQGQKVPVPQDMMVTARIQGNQFYETLVFDQTNQFSVQRVLPLGSYEIFVNGTPYAVYVYTLMDGEKQSIASLEITQDCSIQFIFERKLHEVGALYIQGYRQDQDCDCLKTPYDDCSFALVLQGNGEKRRVLLNKENSWKVRYSKLMPGTYELRSENSNNYTYMVDGELSEQAIVKIDRNAHNIKVISDQTDNLKRKLILEAWQWDGQQKEKPASDFMLWVKVKAAEKQWELLLNEGTHWLGMIEHLQEGMYTIETDGQEEVLYQVEGGQPTTNNAIHLLKEETFVELLVTKREMQDGSIIIEKRIGINEEKPMQGTYTFVLQKPNFEQKIMLNAENKYVAKVNHLKNGRYVLQEEGVNAVTYSIDGGSKRQHAIIEVQGDDHQVIAFNEERVDVEASLQIIGSALMSSVDVILQKAGVEYSVTLNEENDYRQKLDNIKPGRYSLFAKEGTYLYQLDGQSKRSHCTIVFAKDAHEVVLTPSQDELDIADFSKNDGVEEKGMIKLQLWQRDDRGYLQRPIMSEDVVVFIGDQRVCLSGKEDYKTIIQGVSFGEYTLNASIDCLYRIDGGDEHKNAILSIHSKTMKQVDLILSPPLLKRETTRLIL